MHSSLPRYEGVAQLRDAHDLLLKMQHDLTRMLDDDTSAYPVFDFFVTAEHMLDWLHPDPQGAAKRKALKKQHLLLRITSHIANGAKHFSAQDRNHTAVSAIEPPQYVPDGRHDSGSAQSSITIKLSPAEAAVYGATEVDAVTLAYQVFEFWQAQLANGDA